MNALDKHVAVAVIGAGAMGAGIAQVAASLPLATRLSSCLPMPSMAWAAAPGRLS